MSIILVAVLAACGVQSNPATASDEPVAGAPIPIDHVTVERSGESTHVVGYADGVVAIEIVDDAVEYDCPGFG